MKQFFKKSLLEFVALSTTIHSCRVAYFHLDTVLFIFIVLYLCFSSVSACLMQRLSFSLSEIKTYWTTLGLFSDVFFNVYRRVRHILPTFSPKRLWAVRILWGRWVRMHRWHTVGWCARNRLSETVERRQSGLGTHTTGVQCICGHMMPIRQIRAQTDEALLNGSFY